jgi:protease stability complex PrcB-like protein
MHHRSQVRPSALLVGVLLGSIGCSEAPSAPMSAPENAQPVSVQPLPEADPARFSSGMTTRQRLVVRDHATWVTVWPQIYGRTPPAPVPTIDFTSSVVIVAAMGTEPTTSYEITVDDVRTLHEDAWISVTEESPSPECTVGDVITAPVAVVVVPRFAGQATFLEHTSQGACR